MNDLPARVLEFLRPWLGAPAWRIALSGGLDSVVLLDVLARLGQQVALPPVSAVHVHHGLQAAAEDWVAHCAALCAAHQIALQVCRVTVVPGASLEAAARAARYDALAGGLGSGEVLLTAHHRDDQAETVLFRLLRGAGVKGLAGMPASRALGGGVLVRPLLGVSRSELEAWARDKGLVWVEDPSNADVRFSRNALRHTVIPVMAQHWPQVRQALNQTAQHLREAQGLLEELAALDLSKAMTPPPFTWLPLPSLEFTVLAELSEARQRNLLRFWLGDLSAMPDTAHWHGWVCLRDARDDAAPIWRLQGGELHRSAGRLWFVPLRWAGRPAAPAVAPSDSCWLPLPGNGRVRLQGAQEAGRQLRIGYRQGGERLQVPGRGERDLKRLLNEAGVPSFLRSRLPLLFRDDRLVAVANLAHLSEGGATLVWEPPGLR